MTVYYGIGRLKLNFFFIFLDPNRNSKTIRYFKSVNIDDWDELPPEWNGNYRNCLL